MPTEPDQQAVLVLGMHRSGTSAVAGTLVRLGLAAPLTPLPPADDNPRGFYESRPVTGVNHALMAAMGCAWNRCLQFDPDRLAWALHPADHQVIARTLREEYGQAARFVMKDPRLCLTLPAWLPALRTGGRGVSALIVVRHPTEVARSLAVRDRMPEARTMPLWLHYMLEAERQSRGLDRAVLFYDDLLRDWCGCLHAAGRRARIAWPRPIAGQAGVDAFLSTALRHHAVVQDASCLGPPGLRGMIEATLAAFRRLVGDPGAAEAHAALGQVWADFAAWRRAHD